jgi:DNA-binding NtrC family response regulator
MTLPILIVDDAPETGPLLAKLLSAWGYKSDVAQDGEAALRLIADRQYGMAIIDYRMPGMNGVELFRRMRAMRPDMAAVFLTGYPTIDVVYPAIEAGVLRVLSKPPDFEQLLPIVEEHLGKEGQNGPTLGAARAT